MAITVPSTNIQFFSDLGISPAYENSLYFVSESAKDSYFNGLPKRAVFSSCTYQRENRGYIRVQCNISLLYNVDYMRFQNPDFENKWFYAFVIAINYINNNTTEVQYEIDPLLTWMGTFTLKKCYIERQHVRNDNIGANICSEGLPTGEYINEDIHRTIDSSKMNIAIVYSDSEKAGQMSNNIYQGCVVGAFDANTEVGQVNQLIKTIVENNQSDNIVGIYMYPKEFGDGVNAQPKEEQFAFAKPYETVAGYKPRNKKLFCYPYKYCVVDNMEGQTQQYMYEYFNTLPDATSTGNVTFVVRSVVGAQCQVILRPVKYKETDDTAQSTFHNTLSMSHFPTCSWSVDSFKAWLAQKNAYFPLERDLQLGSGLIGAAGKGLSKGAGIGGAVAGGALGTAVAPGIGTVVGAIGGAIGGSFLGGAVGTGFSLLDKTYENEVLNTSQVVAGDKNFGEQAADVLAAVGEKTYLIYEKCITKNYAKMIDDYFTMYGYAIKQVLTPSMNVREHYTYIKTIGCNVGGNLPATDARAIEAIFDNGVRFWKNHTEIGNYDLDNSGVVG